MDVRVELYKESWVLKNGCFWTVVLEKTLESPLDCTEIQLVHPKGNQFWIFIGRTDVEAETPVLGQPELTHLKRPWCWERLRAGGEGDDRGSDGWSDGQGGLVYCSPWAHKELDMTERLNWTESVLSLYTKNRHVFWSSKTVNSSFILPPQSMSMEE